MHDTERPDGLRAAAQAQPTRKLGGGPWLLVAGAVAIVALMILVPRGGSAPEAREPSAVGPTAVHDPQTDLQGVAQRDPADPLAIGDPEAPAAMVVLSDYQCPYCALWHHETLPALMPYVDSGELRIEWVDSVVYGPASERAARAAYAAAQQDALREYRAALFPDGETLAEGQLGDDALLAIAQELGLDAERFSRDYDSEPAAESLRADVEAATALGIYATPAFLVGGQPILGAQPAEVFITAIEHEIEAAGP